MNEQDRQELEAIRAQISGLQQDVDELLQRLMHFEQRISKAPSFAPKPALNIQVRQPPPIISKPPPVPAMAEIQETPVPLRQSVSAADGEFLPEQPRQPEESFELRFGTYWLPRIGIVLLLTGLVFLAGYVHQHLPMWGKVLLLYLVSGGLISAGLLLEVKYEFLGRVMLAGGLAAVYFVTYALHFVEALRLIESAYVDGILLFIWAGVIVGAAQWKRSQPMAGLAFFLGYYTSILPQMPWAGASGDAATPFTLVACGILGAGIVFLFVRNGWTWLTYGGVFATYLSYWLWFSHNQQQFALQVGFLSLFWILFTLAVFLGRSEILPARDRNVFGSANNAAYFALMTFAVIQNYSRADYWIFPALFAVVLLAVSLLLRHRFASDRTTFETFSLQGFGLVSVAIVTESSGYQQLVALAVQAAVLLVLGWRLRWMAARAIAAAAYAVGFFFELVQRAGNFTLLNWQPEIWVSGKPKLIALITATASGLGMAWFDRRSQERVAEKGKVEPVFLSSIYFAVLAAFFALYAIHRFTPADIFPGVTALASITLLVIGLLGRTKEIALASQFPLVVGQIALISLWGAVSKSNLPIWSEAVSIGYTFTLALMMTRRAGRRKATLPISGESLFTWANGCFCWATFLLTLVIFKRTDSSWQFVVLAGEALVILGAGVLVRLVSAVWLNMTLFVVASMIFLFTYDQEASSLGLHATKLLTGFLGVVPFFLSERILDRSAARLKSSSKTTSAGQVLAVALGTGLLLDLLRLGFDPAFLTPLWAVTAFGLFGLGLPFKSRRLRWAGLATMGCALFRVVVYDTAKFHTPGRIVSYMVLGALLLALGFLYTRFHEKIKEWL